MTSGEEVVHVQAFGFRKLSASKTWFAEEEYCPETLVVLLKFGSR